MDEQYLIWYPNKLGLLGLLIILSFTPILAIYYYTSIAAVIFSPHFGNFAIKTSNIDEKSLIKIDLF